MSASLKARLAPATDAIASSSVPCSQSHRSRMRDLSRWMWLSTKPGMTSRPSRCSAGASATMCSAISTMRPPAMAMSTSASLSCARRACRNTRSNAMSGHLSCVGWVERSEPHHSFRREAPMDGSPRSTHPASLSQFLRAAQAGDHGDPQQVVIGAGLVGRDLREAAAEFGPVRLEVAFVLDRLLLDVFERHRPALAIVTFEIGIGLASVPDVDHARGQIDRVMDTAVHAHPSEGIVDMRGVAGEKNAPVLKCLRDPLVHLVKRRVRDLVMGYAGHHGGHQGLGEVGAQSQLVAFMRRDRKHRPAQSGNLQQEVPALGIGDVAYGDEIRDDGAKIEWRAHDQKTLRPGTAGKFYPERAPHVAAGAVGADDPAA